MWLPRYSVTLTNSDSRKCNNRSEQKVCISISKTLEIFRSSKYGKNLYNNTTNQKLCCVVSEAFKWDFLLIQLRGFSQHHLLDVDRVKDIAFLNRKQISTSRNHLLPSEQLGFLWAFWRCDFGGSIPEFVPICLVPFPRVRLLFGGSAYKRKGFFKAFQRCSIGFRSGDCGRQSMSETLLSVNHWLTILDACFE